MEEVLESDPHEAEVILKVALQDWIEMWVLSRHFVHPIRDFGPEVLFVRPFSGADVQEPWPRIGRSMSRTLPRCSTTFSLAPYSR